MPFHTVLLAAPTDSDGSALPMTAHSGFDFPSPLQGEGGCHAVEERFCCEIGAINSSQMGNTALGLGTGINYC